MQAQIYLPMKYTANAQHSHRQGLLIQIRVIQEHGEGSGPVFVLPQIGDNDFDLVPIGRGRLLGAMLVMRDGLFDVGAPVGVSRWRQEFGEALGVQLPGLAFTEPPERDVRIPGFAEDIAGFIENPREVVVLTDPTGEVLKEWGRPNGLKISKRRVPIGVIGIIYESRPNVTSDAASLCLKTGNAVILRGGSETIRSNLALVEAISEGCKEVGLPEYSVQLVPSTERAAVTLMAGVFNDQESTTWTSPQARPSPSRS